MSTELRYHTLQAADEGKQRVSHGGPEVHQWLTPVACARCSGGKCPLTLTLKAWRLSDPEILAPRPTQRINIALESRGPSW